MSNLTKKHEELSTLVGNLSADFNAKLKEMDNSHDTEMRKMREKLHHSDNATGEAIDNYREWARGHFATSEKLDMLLEHLGLEYVDVSENPAHLESKKVKT